ncbi:trehalose-phosphatase [Nitriliruptoraceae bacterium ZYF776]|nr:trehalose-phosphatase [Profundirhabdus halotolerans]
MTSWPRSNVATPTEGPEVLETLDAIADRLGDPRRWTFVFDFDGTLSELVDHPDDAGPVDGARAAVAALGEVAEVALLSGRGVEDLVDRFGGAPDGVLLVGGHGSEAIWPDGRREPLADVGEVTEVLAAVADELEAGLDADAGWLVERKAASVAVHHRRVADAAVTEREPWVHERLAAVADEGPGFEVLSGKAVVELRLRGVDKGRALRWLAERSAGRPPVVVGDDVTDEEAFAAAQDLGGFAVKVGDAGSATVADARVATPAEVVTLLHRVRSTGPTTPSAAQRAWTGRPVDSDG